VEQGFRDSRKLFSAAADWLQALDYLRGIAGRQAPLDVNHPRDLLGSHCERLFIASGKAIVLVEA
jgi:hypothetical protein